MQPGRPANHAPVPGGRVGASLGLVMFSLSSAILLLASMVDVGAWPWWIGVLDVGLALALVALAVWLQAMTRNRADADAERVSYRIYRVALHLLLALLVMFFLVGDQIKWSTLLPGLVWRMWLALYTLPAVLMSWSLSSKR